MLKVGQILRGMLSSDTGESAVWPSVDGAVRFGKTVDLDLGGKEGPVWETFTMTPIGSKIRKTLDRRSELTTGVRESKFTAAVKNKDGYRGWWGERQRRLREHDVGLMGQVGMTIDKHGFLVGRVFHARYQKHI